MKVNKLLITSLRVIIKKNVLKTIERQRNITIQLLKNNIIKFNAYKSYI